jgi:hypothetical protein
VNIGCSSVWKSGMLDALHANDYYSGKSYAAMDDNALRVDK